MGQVIHWKLCKKFEIDHANKWYVNNPEFLLENETYEILWDFEIKTDHLIRGADLEIVNKKREPAEYWTLPFRLNTG